MLDPQTVEQIAAGEVIERPVSVVKELVENAVDAGARRVEVAVCRGGIDVVEVRDDGRGIAPDDLPLAVRRHATSKLRRAADLERIATLGFRGEGLASIAAVARVTIVSRTRDAEIGARVEAFEERVSEVEPHPAPIGTLVRAEGLFENVPVRREYLRAPATEFSRISAWLATFALAYPEVTFVVVHDGTPVWTMPASDDPSERLAMVFGREAARALLALDGAAALGSGGSLGGFISAPGNDRPDRRMQHLFVNGRLVRSASLSGAWTAAYGGFTTTGRHPYGVLFLRVPPEHVDANVHPTKSEVRLRYGAQVFDAVRRAMVATLRAHAAERFRTSTGIEREDGISFALPPQAIDARDLLQPELRLDGGSATLAEGDGKPRIVAQLARTYILAADDDALVLVDQHAAHERIAYEAIVRAARAGAPSEPLIVPLILELDAARSIALGAMLDELRSCGLEIEPFGERTYRVVATPAGYGGKAFDLAAFLDDLASELPAADRRERVWATLACHAVTRAGDSLTHAEMAVLLERLRACENPMHCPHGRPTVVRLDAADLAKLFKRT